ncbi:MAG: hypothetical protein J6P09_01680 [Methanobrevibacter sp.]|nr:hypothetical protein [Methanobrevibacter sp.]
MEQKANSENPAIVAEESEVSLDVIVDQDGETFWATQKTMAEVFGINVPAISKHLKNIFEEGELIKNSVVSKMETTV